MSAGARLLLKLAHRYGIQSAFYGSDRKRKPAQTESLLAVLKALDAPVTTLDDVPTALHEWEEMSARKIIEPVVVAWDGKLSSVTACLPREISDASFNCALILEDGTRKEWRWQTGDTPTGSPTEKNPLCIEKVLPVNMQLPWGYHRLTVETGGKQAETLIISAPVKAYSNPEGRRKWGVFLPLYSLHSHKSWGAGTFSDMKRLAEWAGDEGGSSVATLPLLATFLENPYEPSPYLPVSKLVWNEFYVDVTAIPELGECESARNLVDSTPFLQKVQSLQRTRLVDYRGIIALKRQVIEELSRHFFSQDSPRLQAFEMFISEHPEIEGYATFRAVLEKQKKPWREWHPEIAGGDIKPGDYDDAVRKYYLYAQWQAHQQMQDMAEHASENGVGLYLDLPLGTHPAGFDTWHYRDIFVDGVFVGAPPDIVFTRGQNWTFPPLHPEKIRETGYGYVIGYIRHHLRYAQTLRIDHIMGLHRLFFVPEGMESSQGVYVRYRPEEMYAIFSLESHRYKCSIAGEDLGIVPDSVRDAMDRHSIQRLWVMHYELSANARPLLPAPLSNQIASLNTHDMPPFAAFWSGQDIIDRQKTGISPSTAARREQAIRNRVKKRLVTFLQDRGFLTGRVSAGAVLKSCLSLLAESHAPLVVVNLEDLWGEIRAQNIPSTTTEHPNWRRKARFDLESFCIMPEITTILELLQQLRAHQERNNVPDRKAKKRE